MTKKQTMIIEKNVAKNIAKRQDRKLKYAIVNQRRTKLTSKYTLNNLPYPFENEEQYNLIMKKSLGPEWVTWKTFKKNIKPSISIPMGTLITPIKFKESK